jgi:hypothetical protein
VGYFSVKPCLAIRDSSIALLRYREKSHAKRVP